MEPMNLDWNAVKPRLLWRAQRAFGDALAGYFNGMPSPLPGWPDEIWPAVVLPDRDAARRRAEGGLTEPAIELDLGVIRPLEPQFTGESPWVIHPATLQILVRATEPGGDWEARAMAKLVAHRLQKLLLDHSATRERLGDWGLTDLRAGRVCPIGGPHHAFQLLCDTVFSARLFDLLAEKPTEREGGEPCR